MDWWIVRGSVCYAKGRASINPRIHKSVARDPLHCMTLPRLTAIAALALFAGCNSLENPFAGFSPFRTGHDTRTFNPQTGEYEWPKDATPRPRSRAPRTTGTDAPAPADDGRSFDPQKREFTEPDPRR